MSKCQMCHRAEPTREVTHEQYTLKVCEACKDKYEQDKVYKRIQPLVEKLCSELNGGNKNRIAQALLDAFNREHRYLQAETFNVLMLFFRAYGNQDEGRWFDDRNAHCRKIAKKWYESL